MSDDRLQRLEQMVEDLHAAICGPTDGSRPGLMTTCQVRAEQGLQLVKRVEALEQQADSQKTQQRVTPALVASGIVAAWEIIKGMIKP